MTWIRSSTGSAAWSQRDAARAEPLPPTAMQPVGQRTRIYTSERKKGENASSCSACQSEWKLSHATAVVLRTKSAMLFWPG
eukprot:2551182-Rhodomonas_salina.1